MKNLMIPILTTILLILLTFNKLTSQKEKNSKTFNSPFECGFSNISSTQTFMSHNFFTFNLLFLILELEIVLVIPFTTNSMKSHSSNFPFFLMITLILITMIKEWKNKILDWSK